jgi:hypothetical protein
MEVKVIGVCEGAYVAVSKILKLTQEGMQFGKIRVLNT